MKSFIIHLPSIPASLKTATAMLEKFKEFSMDAELFEGTMGPDAVRKFEVEGRTVYLFGLKGPLDLNSREAHKMTTPGVMGCFDSHYRLWQKCVELDEPVIIWEDDIVLSRLYEPVEWQDVLIVALGHPTKSVRWMHLLENPTGEPEALEYKSPSMPGCCGYAIKPHAAQKLLDTYATTFRPADNAINRTVVKMQIHSHIMGIAVVEGKKSLTGPKAWK
jgi:GR25 family glycosyltransferase involved in LPS biosynthesis